jgi:predicted nucleotidyltransferase
MKETEFAALVEGAVAALKAAGAREVYLFGSAAKGTMRDNSDVDLAVSGLPPAVFFRAMAQASRALGRPLDLVDLDHDNPFTRYLKKEGELHRVG